MKTTTKSYIKIALAATLWGSLGLFGKIFEQLGFPSELTAFSRLAGGWLSMAVLFAIIDPNVFKIDKEGLKYSALIGFFSHGLFNVCYFGAIKYTGVFTAAVLLYVSIIMMLTIGIIFYKESLTPKKVIATLVCMTGCFLGVTGGNLSGLQLNITGITMGLFSAFFYAIMPSLNKKTIKTYNPFTIILYSFLFAWIVLIPFAKPWLHQELLLQPKNLLLILSFGIVASTLPYCLYVPSLRHAQVSKIGVICSVELLASIPIAVIIFKEKLTLGMIIGVALIVFSILLINTGKNS